MDSEIASRGKGVGKCGNQIVFPRVFSQTKLFTAPEQLSAATSPAKMSDVYSLGIVGLELLAGHQLEEGMISSILSAAWQHHHTVGIAQIIEDAIDSNHSHRLLALRVPESTAIYPRLSLAFHNNLTIYREFVSRTVEMTSTTSLLHHLWHLIQGDASTTVPTLYRLSSLARTPYREMTRFLYACSQLNIACRLIIVLSCLLYTYIDAKLYFHIDLPIVGALVTDSTIVFFRKIPHELTFGEFWGNLPGRCVAFTFGIVASRYYSNIFAAVKLHQPISIREVLMNFVIRFNSFSYFVPIMIAVVWSPYCAFAGMVPVALNNAFCYAKSLSCATLMRQHISLAKLPLDTVFDTNDFLHHDFNEWSVLMMLYSLIILFIGVLLTKGVLKDEAAYAAIVCAFYIFKLYRVNCERDAPMAAGNLTRLFFGLYRIRLAGIATTGGQQLDELRLR